jgi:hypothetical protein
VSVKKFWNGGTTLETKKVTWRGELRRYRKSPFEQWDGTMMEHHLIRATEQMKEKYPGNYIVEEYFDPQILEFSLRLKFETPEEETLFLLKYE